MYFSIENGIKNNLKSLTLYLCGKLETLHAYVILEPYLPYLKHTCEKEKNW